MLLAVTIGVGFGIGGIFGGLGPFTAELLAQARSRAFGMAIAYNGGRIGGLVAPEPARGGCVERGRYHDLCAPADEIDCLADGYHCPAEKRAFCDSNP